MIINALAVKCIKNIGNIGNKMSVIKMKLDLLLRHLRSKSFFALIVSYSSYYSRGSTACSVTLSSDTRKSTERRLICLRSNSSEYLM